MDRRPDEHVPRDLGPFAIAPEVRAALAELRHRAGVTGPAEIDADQVRAVEIGVALRFSNDLLAVFAAAVPLLRDRYELALGKVVAHTGELRTRRARGDLVGVGQIARGIKLCVEKKADVGARFRLAIYDMEARTIEPVDLALWLEARASELAHITAAADDFTPMLVRQLPGGSSGRRVRHPVFGEGRVYVELGTGPERKVKVDFPGVGLKLLQARFLEYLD
jgi:hypothetical protein